MSEILHESDFLTVNLGAITKKASSSTSSSNNVDATKNPATNSQKQITDWGAEYRKRVATNNGLSSEAKRTDTEIELEFFSEYFKANWDASSAKQLMSMGEPLKKALKVLGFNKEKNPILGFISDKYVIANLIKTKLLNVNTFKIIYNAVAKKTVAETEFYKANDYNIIYCKDFYKKSLSDMVKYLAYQERVLKPSISEYNEKSIENNKRTFLFVKAITELDADKRVADVKHYDGELPDSTANDTTLNDLKFVSNITGISFDDSGKNTNALKTTKQIGSLVSKLDTLEMQYAAILHFSVAYNIKEAREALRNKAFKGIKVENITAVASYVADIIGKGKLQVSDVKAIISSIMSKLSK